jgi:hypothetical protein
VLAHILTLAAAPVLASSSSRQEPAEGRVGQ